MLQLWLPWWLRRYSVCLQCGRPGFNPWVQKIPWRRKWPSTPALLTGKSHGRRSLVGYSPWGRKESDTTERLHFHFHLSKQGAGSAGSIPGQGGKIPPVLSLKRENIKQKEHCFTNRRQPLEMFHIKNSRNRAKQIAVLDIIQTEHGRQFPGVRLSEQQDSSLSTGEQSHTLPKIGGSEGVRFPHKLATSLTCER